MDEDEILNARQVAEQNPELDATRRQLFGENYLQDIDQGTGIAQYYTGFGNMPTLDYTPAAAVDTLTPVVDTTTPVVDTGGGGGIGIGGDITTPDTGNTDFEQNLLDQGVGVQGAIGDPVVAPGEMPVTQQEMDDFNAPAILDSESTADEIAQDLSNQQAMLNPTGGNIMDEVALTGQTDFVNPADVEAGLATESMVDFAPEQQGLIDQAFSKVGSTAENIMDDLSKIPGAVANFAEQTVDVFGKKINVGKTLLNAGINRLAGGPVSLIVDALGAIKPDKYDQEAQGALGEIDMLKTTEGGLTTDKYGINVQSAFGDYDDYNLERQIDLQEKVDDGTLQQYNEDGTLTYLGKELEDRKTIEQQLNETRLGEAKQEQQDFVQEIEAQPVVQAVSEAARDQQRDTGVASVSTGIGGKGLGGYQTSSGDVYASAAEAAEKGDGGGGGGKIVCTMMNNSYGFGSFRNKIWLKHSRDMAPEYQKGYHKIFLPLVKLSKTNKVLKKILEHIAVHRTIDIRQEARGKMHLLGRVYRKILEPICYIVGKYAKR